MSKKKLSLVARVRQTVGGFLPPKVVGIRVVVRNYRVSRDTEYLDGSVVSEDLGGVWHIERELAHRVWLHQSNLGIAPTSYKVWGIDRTRVMEGYLVRVSGRRTVLVTNDTICRFSSSTRFAWGEYRTVVEYTRFDQAVYDAVSELLVAPMKAVA